MTESVAISCFLLTVCQHIFKLSTYVKTIGVIIQRQTKDKIMCKVIRKCVKEMLTIQPVFLLNYTIHHYCFTPMISRLLSFHIYTGCWCTSSLCYNHRSVYRSLLYPNTLQQEMLSLGDLYQNVNCFLLTDAIFMNVWQQKLHCT